jgi:hypothetical protein
MTQWYPKIANLILKDGMPILTSREFHGVWGNLM